MLKYYKTYEELKKQKNICDDKAKDFLFIQIISKYIVQLKVLSLPVIILYFVAIYIYIFMYTMFSAFVYLFLLKTA